MFHGDECVYPYTIDWKICKVWTTLLHFSIWYIPDQIISAMWSMYAWSRQIYALTGHHIDMDIYGKAFIYVLAQKHRIPEVYTVHCGFDTPQLWLNISSNNGLVPGGNQLLSCSAFTCQQYRFKEHTLVNFHWQRPDSTISINKISVIIGIFVSKRNTLTAWQRVRGAYIL